MMCHLLLQVVSKRNLLNAKKKHSKNDKVSLLTHTQTHEKDKWTSSGLVYQHAFWHMRLKLQNHILRNNRRCTK